TAFPKHEGNVVRLVKLSVASSASSMRRAFSSHWLPIFPRFPRSTRSDDDWSRLQACLTCIWHRARGLRYSARQQAVRALTLLHDPEAEPHIIRPTRVLFIGSACVVRRHTIRMHLSLLAITQRPSL